MYSKEELKQHKEDFWNGFAEYCYTLPRLAHRKDLFILYDTKQKGVELKFDIAKKSVAVVLEFNHRIIDKRIEMYEHFCAYKVMFADEFTDNLDALQWSPFYLLETGKEVSRIYIELPNISYLNRNNWQQLYEFMAPNMIRMEDAFLAIKETIE
ncbi:MAG: DUF4268 domain-containing protein [bacterium]